ncbi:MAG TPA: cupredoxin domain-containing protein [Acidobacteriaceae bacterium]|jgi:cytochrome c oxidase subunit 2|nr:cupredoxin domain-containing protein [Acidobacteriaceae bacterium]
MKKYSRHLIVALMPCALLGFSMRGAPFAHAAGGPRTIEVTAKRFSFSPDEITVKKGEPVLLVFHSEDVTHGIRIRELNIQAEIPKGKSVKVPLTATEAGDFDGRCAHFCGSGHGDMTFTVHVEP